VAGIGPALAGAIVEHREAKGLFRSRQQLLEVPRFGPQAFEQAAGFLRVPGGDHPLDDTAVHPERYAALEALAARLGKGLAELRGPGAALVREATSLKEELGDFTWEDIVAELEKPGRDPRESFVPFSFRDDIRALEDLKPGMVCPGIVNNVTSFGAFVDIGVHHDGLVHVSQLAPPAGKNGKAGKALEPGDRVQVRVLKLDLEKKQISLTMRTPPERRPASKPKPKPARRPEKRPAAPAVAGTEGAAASPARPDRPARPPGERPRPRPAPAAPDGRRLERPPRPNRPAESRRPPGPAASDRKPEPRRQVFNNPFAVLAGLKVPPKK
jgi:uncharacterized protein